MDSPARPLLISGPPGSGKSTLVAALRAAGFVCFNEVSREVIREQRTVQGRLTPWNDLPGFAEECFQRMRAQRAAAELHERSFLDRGVPDLIGYLRRGGRSVPKRYFDACGAYARLVFMAPPWEEIYVNDPERPQSFPESLALAEALTRAYRDCGFTMIVLPRASVEARVACVCAVLRERAPERSLSWEN